MYVFRFCLGCRQIYDQVWTDHVIMIIVVPESNIFNTLLCDLSNEGWQVIQRRVDVTVDFQLPWDDYVYSFGELDGNFWIGLETMYQLTSGGFSHVKFYLESFDDPGMNYSLLNS